MKHDTFLTVVMPGFNEEKVIYENILYTCQVLGEFVTRYEIIFVDDGSHDETLNMATKAAKKNSNVKVIPCQKNSGKGNALKLGVASAEGNYVAFLDSDLDISPKLLKTYIETMIKEQVDVVIGSKLHPESKLVYPLARKIVSFGYYCILMCLFRLNVRDTQTGIKLFKAEAIKPVMEKILVKRYAYDIEVLAILNRQRKKILDAPVEVSFKRCNKWGRIKLSDVFYIFWDTLAVFYRLYILKYYDHTELPEIDPLGYYG